MNTGRKKYRLFYKLEKEMEIPMFFFSLFWLYLFIMELVKGLSPVQEILLYVVWGLFLFEFLLKLFLSPRKWNYIRNNWITGVALIIPAFRVLRLFYAFRILQSARFISSSRIIRALTSSKRFITELKEAQGSLPEPEIHAGVMIQLNKKERLQDLNQFAHQIINKVESELEHATAIPWYFHFTEHVQLASEKPVRPSEFLDEATYAMSQAPYDLLIVITDRHLVSQKGRMKPGLVSVISRVAVISAAHLTATKREKPNRSLTDEDVTWNGANLLLHLTGSMLGLRQKKQKKDVMSPFTFHSQIKQLLNYSADQKKELRKNKKNLPERELQEGNSMESFVFHILMASRHIKQVLHPLLRNKALLLPLSLPRLATAATAPTILLIFTAEIWDVGINLNNLTATIFALVSVLAASIYLVRVQALFFPRKEKKILTEHMAVANTVIYLSILLAVTGLFLMLSALMLIIQYYVFPNDLMQTWPTLDKKEITTVDQVRLAAFISTIGVITGALGGGLETKKVIQHLALFDEL